MASTDPGTAAIDQALMDLFRRGGLHHLHAQVARSAGIPLERAGYALLGIIAEHQPLMLSELARHLGVDTSTVSRQISQLETAGLVARQQDPNDARVALLTVTRGGRAALKRLRDARRGVLAEALAGWTPEDKDQLAALLERMVEDLTTGTEAP